MGRAGDEKGKGKPDVPKLSVSSGLRDGNADGYGKDETKAAGLNAPAPSPSQLRTGKAPLIQPYVPLIPGLNTTKTSNPAPTSSQFQNPIASLDFENVPAVNPDAAPLWSKGKETAVTGTAASASKGEETAVTGTAASSSKGKVDAGTDGGATRTAAAGLLGGSKAMEPRATKRLSTLAGDFANTAKRTVGTVDGGAALSSFEGRKATNPGTDSALFKSKTTTAVNIAPALSRGKTSTGTVTVPSFSPVKKTRDAATAPSSPQGTTAAHTNPFLSFKGKEPKNPGGGSAAAADSP